MNLSQALSRSEGYERELSRDGDRACFCSDACLLCGSNLRLVLEKVTDTRFGIPGFYDICQCSACGFEQISPIPSFEVLKNLYEDNYNFGGETGTVYTRLREGFIRSALYRAWTMLDGDISFHLRQGNGRLLDIGCNEGRGLTIYMRNGFQVEGLELNESAAAVARKRGFVVHTCLLNDLNPREPYCVAVLSNVLEHSLNPREMIDDVFRILERGGQIWISCPNSSSWLRKLFGRSWINWHVPFHISHFSSATLRRILLEAGYRDIEIQHLTPSSWVAGSLLAYFFSKPGKINRKLRNPLLVPFLLLFVRFILFPGLWAGNRLGRGDCLLVVAKKDGECES